MTLIEYFNKVKNEIRNNNYKIINIKSVSIPSKISIHIESLNYMIYEWNEDHKDNRNDIFNYIIRPNDCDFDFTSITFEEFFKFLMLSKDQNNEMVDLKDEKEKTKYEQELEEFDDFFSK